MQTSSPTPAAGTSPTTPETSPTTTVASPPTAARRAALAGATHLVAPTNTLERLCLSASTAAPESTGLASQPAALPLPVPNAAPVPHTTSVPHTAPVSYTTTPQLLPATLRPATESLP